MLATVRPVEVWNMIEMTKMATRCASLLKTNLPIFQCQSPVFSPLTHAWVALNCSYGEDYPIEIWAIFRINSMSVAGVEEENTAN